MLHVSSHIYAYLRDNFGKGGILHFRETGRHIAAFTLEQMCRLFYLKRASVAAFSYTTGVDGDLVLRFRKRPGKKTQNGSNEGAEISNWGYLHPQREVELVHTIQILDFKRFVNDVYSVAPARWRNTTLSNLKIRRWLRTTRHGVQHWF